MTNTTQILPDNQTPSDEMSKAERVQTRLAKRKAAETRFKLYGLISIGLALSFLGILFFTIINNGLSAFQQTEIRLDIYVDSQKVDPDGNRDPSQLARGDYHSLVKQTLRDLFPEVNGRKEKRELYSIISIGAAFELRDYIVQNPDFIGTTISLWVPASDDVDMLIKGKVERDWKAAARKISDKQLVWVDELIQRGDLEAKFNKRFFLSGDSREPELAGILGASVGSFWMLLVTLALSFPIGVFSAVYLEEFAPKNKWTDLIEVNINNLAAVPSIVFGLLGLALFLNVFGLPRSAPLVGGMVLSLMTLPTIIISGRASLKAVPPSIREAALGMGASRLQVVMHHVLPLAMPGILTGTVIGMAQALGETAPLLMIGMVAFIVDIPGGPTDAATALPVQIYLWADSPERAFVEKMSAAIMVLLGFLITMNMTAIILRKKFERSW